MQEIHVVKAPSIPDFNPFTLVVDAYACDEHGDGPAFAEIEVTPDWIGNIQRLAKVAELNGLERSSTGDAPGWDQDEELRITYDTLFVYGDGVFYYQASPKHSGYNVETRSASIETIAEIALAGPDKPVASEYFRWKDGTLYLHGDPGQIIDLIDTYEASQDDQED